MVKPRFYVEAEICFYLPAPTRKKSSRDKTQKGNFFKKNILWISREFLANNLFIIPQTQLSHGFPMAYADRRGDYGTSLSGSGSVGRLGSGPGSGHDHDPLSLHQALQNAVDDQEQNQVCDEAATTFMTDLPLLKSEYLSYSFSAGEKMGTGKLDTPRGKQGSCNWWDYLLLAGIENGTTYRVASFVVFDVLWPSGGSS